MYVGMRSREEFHSSIHLFDTVIWVEASERIPPESIDSCTLSRKDLENIDIPVITIYNNGTLEELVDEINSKFP